jgi:hypothetical protein
VNVIHIHIDAAPWQGVKGRAENVIPAGLSRVCPRTQKNLNPQ